jgi:hypothetical protein
MDNNDTNDDIHNMGVAMGEQVMQVYPMMMMCDILKLFKK